MGKQELADKFAAYLSTLPPDRQEPVRQLRAVINKHIPAGFQEVMANGPAWVVPLTRFPAGYHCAPNTPLPFLSIASQKGHLALHHFGMYGDSALSRWFVEEYTQCVQRKPDMGKACVRFKKMDQIPFELIGELAGKLTVDQWLDNYQKALAR